MLSSLLSFSLLSLVAFSSASPLAVPRDVPTSVCNTIVSGYLKTKSGSSVSFNSNGDLVYGGASMFVKFQSCQPNFGGYDGKDGRPYGGHILVPSINKCVAVPNSAANPAGTYHASAQECEFTDDSVQTFFNFVDETSGYIYWVGATQADGSFIHGADQCPSGTYGPSGIAYGKVRLQCETAPFVVPFVLVSKA